MKLAERGLRRAFGWMALAGMTVVTLVAGEAPGHTSPPVDPAIKRAMRAPETRPRVLALYYGWYGKPPRTPELLHYRQIDAARRKIGSHTHVPELGPYDSTDPAVMTAHVHSAREAGVDTLVCSWWGKGDQTDRSFRELLPLAAHEGLTVCPMFELHTKPGDVDAIRDTWDYLLTSYGSNSAWLHVGDRPVIFLYGAARTALSSEQWADLLTELEEKHRPGVAVIADGIDYESAFLFDGMFHLPALAAFRGKSASDVAEAYRNEYAPLLRNARRFGSTPVLAVCPGFGEPGAKPDTVVDRSDGSLYRAQWEASLSLTKGWVLVNSFNQWHNGTEIEPSVEYKDQYLRLTQEYSQRLHHGKSGKQ